MKLAWLGRGGACAFFLGAVLSMGLPGCGERQGTTAAAETGAPVSTSPEPSAEFAAQVLATAERARQESAARAAASPRVPWPAPVPTASGGRRIDLRNFPDHVHTLERQPDGSWKQVCRENKQPRGPRGGL